MKTDKILHLIQQKNVMRSGGALPMHQTTGPVSSQNNIYNLVRDYEKVQKKINRGYKDEDEYVKKLKEVSERFVNEGFALEKTDLIPQGVRDHPTTTGYCIGTACYLANQAGDPFAFYSNSKAQDDARDNPESTRYLEQSEKYIQPSDILQFKVTEKDYPYHAYTVLDIGKKDEKGFKPVKVVGSSGTGPVHYKNYYLGPDNKIYSNPTDLTPLATQLLKRKSAPNREYNKIVSKRNELKKQIEEIYPDYFNPKPTIRSNNVLPTEFMFNKSGWYGGDPTTVNYEGGDNVYALEPTATNRFADQIFTKESKLPEILENISDIKFKEDFMKRYNIRNDEYDAIAKTMLGIYGAESKFGTDYWGSGKLPEPQFLSKLLGIGSVGPFQINRRNLSKDLRERYSNEDLHNPQKAAQATMEFLAEGMTGKGMNLRARAKKTEDSPMYMRNVDSSNYLEYLPYLHNDPSWLTGDKSTMQSKNDVVAGEHPYKQMVDYYSGLFDVLPSSIPTPVEITGERISKKRGGLIRAQIGLEKPSAAQASTVVARPVMQPLQAKQDLPPYVDQKVIDSPFVSIVDTRKIHPVTGKPIDPNRDLKTGEYPKTAIRALIKEGKKYGLSKNDILNNLAISLQESGLGTIDEELGHAQFGDYRSGVIGGKQVFPSLAEEESQAYAEDPYLRHARQQLLNYQYNTAILNKPTTDRIRQLQYYNTPYPKKGKLTSTTELDYYKNPNKMWYGVDVTKNPLSTETNPYGKVVSSFIPLLEQNPMIQRMLYEQGYKRAGGLAKAQRGKQSGFITYSDNPDYFNSRAVLSDDPTWNDKVKQLIYQGKAAYDPSTGAIQFIDSSGAPADVQQMATRGYTEGVRRDPTDPRYAGAEDRTRQLIEQSTQEAYQNPLMYAPGSIGMAMLPATWGTAYGLTQAGTQALQGNYGNAALTAGLSMLPIAGTATRDYLIPKGLQSSLARRVLPEETLTNLVAKNVSLSNYNRYFPQHIGSGAFGDAYRLKNFPNLVVKTGSSNSSIASMGDVQASGALESLPFRPGQIYPRYYKSQSNVPNPEFVNTPPWDFQVMSYVPGKPLNRLTGNQMAAIPKESWKQLIDEIEYLRPKNVGIDFAGDNISYDPLTKRFGLYDLTPNASAAKPGWRDWVLKNISVDDSPTEARDKIKEAVLGKVDDFYSNKSGELGWRFARNTSPSLLQAIKKHRQIINSDPNMLLNNQGVSADFNRFMNWRDQLNDKRSSVLQTIQGLKKGGLTSAKAKEILHDKSVHGHPLTDKQRRFFGAIASGNKIRIRKNK